MSIFFDPERNVYVDKDTGTIIPIEEGDYIPQPSPTNSKRKHKHHHHSSHSSSRNESSKSTHASVDRDHELAIELSLAYDFEDSKSSVGKKISANQTISVNDANTTKPVYRTIMDLVPLEITSNSTATDNSSAVFSGPIRESRLERELYNQHFQGTETSVTWYSKIFGKKSQNQSTEANDDWTIARALQAMEFEMDEDLARERHVEGEFVDKEYTAAACKSQMLTLSTLIVLIQIAVLIAEIQQGGYASRSQNPMIGPPAQTLINFGAKDAYLIIDRKQWWRCLSSVFVHAGILHLLSNGAIQLRVGGYLNRVFGTARWLWIYLISGWFGNMFSCIVLPNDISVGSSGAVLGMLSSWIVWIIFRWKKIPPQARGNRNCQLFIVFTCVAITLGTSFAKYVDYGAHFGGVIQGILWSMILLSHELDNKRTRMLVIIFAASASSALFIWAFYTMLLVLKPPVIV